MLTLLSVLAIWASSVAGYSITLLSRTALVLSGTGTPEPDDTWMRRMMLEHVYPTMGSDISRVIPVRAPMQGWPMTHPFSPRSNPAFKEFGVSTFGPSIRMGVQRLEAEMALHPNQALLVGGFSQGAIIAAQMKQKLADNLSRHPDAPPPEIQFALLASLKRPNGGLFARFPGWHIPIVDVPLSGPAPTDTPFKTIDMAGQYDGFADFPLYPLNGLATVNAVMGLFFVHAQSFGQVSLDPRSSEFVPGTYKQQRGDTTYFFVPTHQLPLLAPLRTLGFMEPLLQAVEAPLRYLIELGYDRSVPFGQSMPARLFAPGTLLSHVTRTLVAMEGFVRALAEGMQNAWTSALCGGCKLPPTVQPLPPGSALVTDQGNLPPRNAPLPSHLTLPQANPAVPHDATVAGSTAIPSISAAPLHQPTSDNHPEKHDHRLSAPDPKHAGPPKRSGGLTSPSHPETSKGSAAAKLHGSPSGSASTDHGDSKSKHEKHKAGSHS
ncbi:PE-PPE domain-containing protein [Mycobacteroides salmoniphilum]|uniref:PE-PPE domain-containing protein n=2 Tax=Mycobacteroides salmoniphilum TaxID=404941 RepID=UPI00195C3C59|nr:PE-PPE domain-containing protein [Mycobacteroides salmoniphilum]